MEDKSNKINEESLRETMERGVAFEEVIRSKGFEFIKAYIENQIKLFANKAIMEGFKTMEDYQLSRGMVIGLQRLLGEIESSLKTLKDEREKVRKSTSEQ